MICWIVYLLYHTHSVLKKEGLPLAEIVKHLHLFYSIYLEMVKTSKKIDMLGVLGELSKPSFQSKNCFALKINIPKSS